MALALHSPMRCVCARRRAAGLVGVWRSIAFTQSGNWGRARGRSQNFDVLLLYGQKAIFRKKIISAQNKFNRNEVVLMMLSNSFSKTLHPPFLHYRTQK